MLNACGPCSDRFMSQCARSYAPAMSITRTTASPTRALWLWSMAQSPTATVDLTIITSADALVTILRFPPPGCDADVRSPLSMKRSHDRWPTSCIGGPVFTSDSEYVGDDGGDPEAPCSLSRPQQNGSRKLCPHVSGLRRQVAQRATRIRAVIHRQVQHSEGHQPCLIALPVDKELDVNTDHCCHHGVASMDKCAGSEETATRWLVEPRY